MGIVRAFTGALGGTFADQWRDIITAGGFDEYVAVAPGMLQSTNNGRGSNYNGSSGVITNGSKIYVPENTAAFIFSQSGIEEIITEAGGYEYHNGQSSIFNGDGVGKSIFSQVADRFSFGGVSADNKQIAFVNLREIRDIKFGTKGAQMYHDMHYDTDLEIFAYGSFTIKITDATKFVRNFLPANTTYYSFADRKAREQIVSEFLQSFAVALNSLSTSFRISQLPSQSNAISQAVKNDGLNAGTWAERFGFSIVQVAVENIEFSEDSRELVKQYSANKMSLKAYEDVSQRASNIAAQQKIAQGIQDNGFGEMGNMIMGMNLAQGMGTLAEPKPAQQTSTPAMSFDEQIETLKKLKELVDAGILTEEEFNAKKREIMGL